MLFILLRRLLFRHQKKIAILKPSFSLLSYFSVLLNSLFSSFGVPTFLQLRRLHLSLFWENMPNCPADDNLLYPCSVTSPLPPLRPEHSTFQWFPGNLSHGSPFPLFRDLGWSLVFAAPTSPLGGRVFVSDVVFQCFIFIRED